MMQNAPQGPMPRYRALIDDGAIHADPAQRLVVEKLQLLHMHLVSYDPAKPKRFGRALFGWGREKIAQEPVTGVYMYGGVGRGKSMLMDLFFESAPLERKRRVHFHAFMQEVHHGIKKARETGDADPIPPVADAIAESATLLCFDEVQVTDIADAMILGRLFEGLFEHGVVVVATSNRPPDDLYKDGLNRDLFLPFIEMFKKRLDVLELNAVADYRRGRDAGAKRYFSPLDPDSAAEMDAAWDAEVAGGTPKPATLEVNGREVRVEATTETAARATFAELCEKPLGAADYLALAERYDTVFLDAIPTLSRAKNNEAKRFVTLIDSLYEARARFICSAAAEPDFLYTEGAGAFEFARTASRLDEMRSVDWPPEED